MLFLPWVLFWVFFARVGVFWREKHPRKGKAPKEGKKHPLETKSWSGGQAALPTDTLRLNPPAAVEPLGGRTPPTVPALEAKKGTLSLRAKKGSAARFGYARLRRD